MNILFVSLFAVLMALAWGMGGEPNFGKWKRGALLIIPMTLVGIGALSWIQLILQAVFLCILYQITIPSKLAQGNIWGDKPNKKPWLGWLLIALNGAIFGLTPVFFASALGLLLLTICGALAWCAIMWVSNEPKLQTARDNYCNSLPDLCLFTYKGVRYGKLRDFWFQCECAMGIVLFLLTMVVR